jgi:hypothetical protein
MIKDHPVSTLSFPMKVGVGVRQALFPMPTLGAALAAGFPTLFSTASGVVGLIAGPSIALRRVDY